MIYTYQYIPLFIYNDWGTNLIFLYTTASFFQFYAGPKPSQNVEGIQTGIYVLDIVYT